MSIYVDTKYITLASTKLERFLKKGPHLFQCRCPFCGDSKKNKLKSRGYFIRDKNEMFYKCHNCNLALPMWKFLKMLDKTLYSQYKVEEYMDIHGQEKEKVPDYSAALVKPVFTKKINLPKISELNDDHIAKQYVIDRKIPKFHWDRLYFAEDFLRFCDEHFPEHGKKLPRDDMRLVIPFWDQKKILQGVQGRTLSNSDVRYITIRAREDMIKVFGLDLIDFTKPIMVVEGPIDSMFLTNSIATMDASLSRIIKVLGDYDYVFVHDNERRNAEIIRTMRQSINTGKKVCIWPSNVMQKDINDMVLAGLNPQEIISKRTFSGPRAMLEFEMWRKV